MNIAAHADNEPNRNGRRAPVVYEGDNANRDAIAFQAMQAAYAELTGKVESLERHYAKPLLIEAADFRNLHHQIAQFFNQYEILQTTCSYMAVYTDDSREKYTSYERFEFHTHGSSKPIEAVLVEYNYLIRQPSVERPQSYKLMVRATSKVALMKRMEEELHGLPAFLRSMNNRTLLVRIEYVDYVVGRSLLSFMDEWVKSIHCGEERKWVSRCQALTHHLSGLIAAITVIAIFLGARQWLGSTDGSTVNTIRDFFSFGLSTLALAYAGHYIGGLLGGRMEESIDRLDSVSYIKLTAADGREIDKAMQRNKQTWFRFGVSVLGAILLNVAANVVTRHLGF